LTQENDNWQRMRFKNNKVWVALDDTGEPLIKNGKLLIKYQLDQPHEYWVHSRNVQPIDRSTDHAGPPPPKQRSRTATVPEMASVDCAESLCVFTDGASLGNPGPAGIGILMRFGDHEKEISRFIGVATNNVAELEAIRTGLLNVKKKRLPVRIFTDSGYAYGLLALGWKPKTNLELVAAIRKLMATFKDVRLIKVKGHAGHPENERADHLATTAAKAARER
jgi:ribonuclease HI